MSGQGITNWRYQPDESKLNQGNVKSQLSLQWAATLGGDISATPAVVDGVAYVPDWGGYRSAVDTKTGTVIWQKSVSTLADASGPMVVVSGSAVPGTGPVVSRTSPAVSGNAVVIGTQAMMSAEPGVGAGAQLIAVDRSDGHLLWRHKLDDHPLSIDTASPTIYNGVVYVGVASVEENGIDCGASINACNFRGNENAVKLADGSLIWKTYTITTAQSLAGYSGAAVWGSSPAIDLNRNSVYIATGNNYGAPPAVSACVAAAGSDPTAIFACEATLGVGNDVDAAMSLDLCTGAVKWVHKLQGFDAWTTACIGLPTACPSPNGPDYDFGQGPMLIPTKAGDIVAAGEKAGIVWGLNAATGAIVWKTLVGPGSSLGGLEWGSATDGQAHLLRRGQPQLRSRRALHDGEPAQGYAGDVGRRKLGRRRPGDGSDHLADGRSERIDRYRSGERRERGRVCGLDGRTLLPAIREHRADDVRPRREERHAALVVHERRIRQRRARDRRRHGLLGLGLHAPRLRRWEQPALRLRKVRAQVKEAGETVPGFLRVRRVVAQA